MTLNNSESYSSEKYFCHFFWKANYLKLGLCLIACLQFLFCGNLMNIPENLDSNDMVLTGSTSKKEEEQESDEEDSRLKFLLIIQKVNGQAWKPSNTEPSA